LKRRRQINKSSYIFLKNYNSTEIVALFTLKTEIQVPNFVLQIMSCKLSILCLWSVSTNSKITFNNNQTIYCFSFNVYL